MIPVNIPDVRQEDVDAVSQCLLDGWISGEGPVVAEFEKVVAHSVGRQHGIAVSNGSDALDLAFAAIPLKPGDEVILPSFTIISCLAPILRMGLVPVFVDADPLTWNMRVDQVEASISPKTRAILMVHLYGLAAEVRSILDLAETHGLIVIEDAAEAHGIEYEGQPCGSFGHLSTFSFYANKNLTTGEGGMVLTDDPVLADRLRLLRNLSFRPEKRFVHDELGWNMRLTSPQAALGISQAARLQSNVLRRREIAKKYIDAMSHFPWVQFQAESHERSQNGYWVVGVKLLSNSPFSNAVEAMTFLAEHGIGTRPFFFPLHKQPLLEGGHYQFRIAADMGVSEDLGENGFYLPNGLGMSDQMLAESVDRTVQALTSLGG